MITASSHNLDAEISAARLLHPLAKKHLREIKDRVDLLANRGANLYYCARDTLAALEPEMTNTVRSQAASSATILLSLHAHAKGYRRFTNALGVSVWAKPL